MLRTLLVLALCLAPASPQSFPLTQQTCDADRRKASVQTAGANVVLGGLFDIREPSSSGAGCGLPSKEMMQVYEAARWTIGQLNTQSYVPGVTFGLEAYDTCTMDSTALKAVQEFYPQAAGRQGISSAGVTYCTKSPNPYKLGMIGPMQSSSAQLVGQMLPNIPASTVSMGTAAPGLSNKNLYPTYLRTFPSVSVLARAASKLFKQFQWEKMVIVYADDADSMEGYQEFLGALTSAGICVSGAISVPHGGNVALYQAELQNVASFGATAALFYGNPTDALTTLNALQLLQSIPNSPISAAVRDMKWMFGRLDSTGAFSSLTSAQGAITALPTTQTLAAFRTHFTGLNILSPPADNPWLQDWYMNTYQCRLPGVSYAPFSTMSPCTTNPNPCTSDYVQSATMTPCTTNPNPRTCDYVQSVTMTPCTTNPNLHTSDYVQSAYVVPTVQSILAYAEALKRVCSGSSGVCSALTTMNPISFHNNYLSDVDVTFPSNFFISELRGTRLAFDVNGDPLTSDYTFYSYNNGAFTQIADYTSSSLTVTTNPTFPRPTVANLPLPSQCSTTGDCSNCLTPTSTLTLAYKAGDVVVAALVDTHQAGSNGLDCGAAIPDRLIDAVAVRYGADEATRTSGQGLSVGYLIVDVCPGLAAAESFLTNLMGGFKLYMDAAGNVITTNNIVAVLDMTQEDTAGRIAPILAASKLPQIRMASTSQMLLHHTAYPNLISAVPSQETVQLSIVQMLYKLDLKYVQIISEATGSYYRAAESFRRLASRMDICVALWSTFGTDSQKTANRLRNVAGAPVVVVFGSTTHVRSLLDGIQAVTGGVASQRVLTLVSGSEEFGSSTTVSSGLSTALSGALFVRLDQIRNSAFDTWLSGLSQSQIVSDAFLAEWFEQKNDCSLTSSSRLRYDRVCSASTTISFSTVYQGYAPYIIRGIASLLNYVNEIVDEACGTAVPNCAQFRNLADLSDRIVNKLRNSNDNTQFEIQNGEGMSDLTFVNFRSGVYADVGLFDTEKRGVTTLNTGSIVLGNGQSGDAARTQCVGRCAQCQYAYGYQEVGYVPGDWLLAGTFSVSNPGPDGQRPYVCGEAQTIYGFQETAAMMYALDRVNSGQSSVRLRNVTLGGLIMDHCDNERRAYGQVSDIYSGLTELTWRQNMGETAPPFMATDILAWLTDTTASTQEAAEMTQPLGVAIVSPSATSAGLMDNPTFFRTIQGDATTATAIVKLCKTLGFSFLQVVHGADSYGREGQATLTNVARQEGLCVINTFEMTQGTDASSAVTAMAGGTSRVVVLYLGSSLTSAFLQQAALQPTDQRLTILSPEHFSTVVAAVPNRFNLANNLLSLRLQNPAISDFNDYLNEVEENSRRNPFFAKYYMKTFSCNLDGYYMYSNDCPANQRITEISDFALSTINAVYSVAAALQATLVQFCGEDYVGQCPAFLAAGDAYTRFVENLKVIQFQDPTNKQFRFLQREGNVVYDLLQFDGSSYQTIGTYGSASLSLSNSGALTAAYSGVISQCSSTCSECIFNSLEFSHTPGDIYLGGVFDVHGLGQGVFDCGAINTEHGFQLLEAFHFALEQVNNDKQGIFKDVLTGVTLGGIGLDACESAIRGGYLVSNINNGLTQLVKDGKEIKASDIDVYIGPYSSDSSIYLARILTDLQTPQISYAATSNTLENKFVYPYFFRTVPPDDKLVLGMLRYLDANNLRYVQLLFADSSYGQQGVAQFDLLIRAHNFSICVAQRVIFPERAIVSRESSDDVVFDLLKKPVANTVVIFAGTDHIRAFLQAVERSQQATATFKFVGPTTWGYRNEVTQGIRDVANDAVTFVLDFQGGVGGFLNSYLELRNPTNAGNNPWFEEWFQLILNCYTTPTNAARYPTGCSPNVDLKNRVVEDNDNLHVMNAVYSAAFAIHDTLKMKCGENYAAVCEAYRSSTDRRTVIRDQLEGVNFTDPTNTQFRFVDRAGNKGYKLFKQTSDPNVAGIYTKEPIGEFSSDDALTLNMALTPKYDGSCERKDACVECPTIRNRGVRFAVGGDPNGATTLVGVFDVHEQGSELYQCSDLNMEGFLKFLAFFWTYSQAAASSGVRLLALDTCSNSMRVGQDLYGILNDGKLCNSDFFSLDKLGLDNVGGVVVTGDENTAAASRLLEQLKVTYVSPDATSPLMDGNQYLLRSRTPWSGYMSILSQFLDNSGWSYVNTIYNNADMGQEEYLAFQKVSKDAGICLHSNLGLAEDATDADISAALRGLDSSTGARAVVLFTKPAQTISILRLAQQLGIADDYLWIWANDSPQVIMDMIPAGASFQAVILQPKMYARDDFTQWVSNIQFDQQSEERNRVNIPRVWMEDFFQTMHRCKLSDAMYPLTYTAPCDLTTVKVNFNSSSDSAHYTHLASGFSMKGLEKFFEDCLSGETVAQCLRRKSGSRQIIRDSILATTLNVDNTDFVFNKPMRYVQTDYEMYIIDVDNGALTKNELYRSYSGGKFSSYNRILNRQSVCTSEDGCGCKVDNPFAGRQTGPSFKPTMPRNYYKYSKNNEQVYEWPIWAIVVAVLTCIGLLVTIINFLYLLFAYPIKGGTSVLGYLTMIGIMGIYAVNFAFFLHASDATCGARRFMMGVVYCIVFAALLVKAVDNWRFADMEYSNHQYRGLTNSVTLLLMALGIVLIQCIIPIEWLILVHPTATQWTTLAVHDYWWCDPHDFYDIGLVLSFIFVVFIVLLTAIFAALAWDSESNNRESRWILVSAIATAGCLMVWMIVTTNAGPVYRDPAVAIANFVNATLLLILIPLRKTVLLCQAEDEKPDDFVDYDPYSNVYANQSFDPDVEDYTFPEGDKREDDLTSN